MVTSITVLVITLFVLFPLSKSRQRIRCPLSCACDPDTQNPGRVGVTCEDKRTWSALPILPQNTTYLRMKNSNMTVLRSAVDNNYGGRHLSKLLLMNMNISVIDVDVFPEFEWIRRFTFAIQHPEHNSVWHVPEHTTSA